MDTSGTTAVTHNPAEAATQMAGKLAAAGRHVCAILGAGASKAAGLPDLSGLTEMVRNLDWGDRDDLIEELFAAHNLEEVLDRLRRIAALLEEGEEFGGLTAADATQIEHTMTAAIIDAVRADGANPKPYVSLAEWVSGGYYHLPIEIFNLNYDLLTEVGLENVGVPYFDGFVGTLNAVLRPDLVDAIDPRFDVAIPREFVRLWKLHGSVNWAAKSDGVRHTITRLGTPAQAGEAAAIYPGEAKYQDSRRQPYLVMFDRFRRAIAMPETLALVSGYSFGDQHVNEILFEAASHHPRSEIVAFCYDAIPSVLSERALVRRNITVFGACEAIVGGARGPWKGDELAGIFEGDRFLLGSFAHLAAFLPKPGRSDD